MNITSNSCSRIKNSSTKSYLTVVFWHKLEEIQKMGIAIRLSSMRRVKLVIYCTKTLTIHMSEWLVYQDLQGRLTNAIALRKDYGDPIYLPKYSPVTSLIILFFHQRNMHCGVQHTFHQHQNGKQKPTVKVQDRVVQQNFATLHDRIRT